MTQQQFLTAYKAELLQTAHWTTDDEKLARFMRGCEATISGRDTCWNHDGPSCLRAWKAIGGKGKPTLKALRALPDTDEGRES